jgi:hypothetical protein
VLTGLELGEPNKAKHGKLNVRRKQETHSFISKTELQHRIEGDVSWAARNRKKQFFLKRRLAFVRGT